MLLNVIAAIPDMAGIEADANFFLMIDAVDDGAQFLKAASDFRAFACHGLKKHRCLLLWMDDIVELLCNKFNAFFRALSDMAARMEVVEIIWQVLKACKVVGHGVMRENTQIFLGGTGIHRIGSMGDERAEAMFFLIGQEFGNILKVEFLGAAAARIARKESKDVGVEFYRFFAHGEKPLGRGEVAANVQISFVWHNDTPIV